MFAKYILKFLKNLKTLIGSVPGTDVQSIYVKTTEMLTLQMCVIQICQTKQSGL